MSKRFAYLISAVLVLGLVLPRPADAQEPGLAGWWRFDGDATDSSGNGNNGTVVGDPQWVVGKIGEALDLDGADDYVDCGSGASLNITGPITISAWIYPTGGGGGGFGRILDKSSGNGATDPGYKFYHRAASNYVVTLSVGGGNRNTGASLVLNSWNYFAFVATGTQWRVLINETWQQWNDTHLPTSVNNPLWLGNNSSTRARQFDGLLDDVRIYSRALTDEEIQQAKEGGKAYPYALSPNPPDGALHDDTWISLGWRAGDFAVSHDVYLGESFDDVNAGAAGTFRGNQTSTSLFVGLGLPGDPYPGGLVPGTTYYWRIDEVNNADPNSPWKGQVWSFVVPSRKAYHPDPPDGAKYIATEGTTLSWTAGMGAKVHTVYFGDNFADVNNAADGPPLADTTYTPGTLQSDKTYYWRVDEFDGLKTYRGDVWGFTTLPDIPVSDPNLLGWWKLDEGQGTVAVDWSGHGNHGEIRGNPQWVGGRDGGALDFDGSGDFIFTGKSASALGIEGAKPKTVTAWVYTRTFNSGAISDMGARTNGQDFCLRTLTTVNQWRTQHWGSDADHDFTYPSQNVWVHFALVYTGTESTVYANGMPVSSKVAALDTSAANPFQIGCYGWQVNYFNGLIDDVRLYNKALMPADIQLLMRIDLQKAWNPKPVDGSTLDIENATPLTWLRGDSATQHAVYFGTDATAVADANSSDTTGVYRGQQVATSYTPTEGVQWGGGPYYWRVDEINNDGTVAKGRVWSFKVTDYLIVDDIESYNDIDPPNPDSHRIFEGWIDGFGTTTNGALVGNDVPPYTEQTIVHDGVKSMPFSYSNAGTATYSEAERTFVPAQDWTKHGIKTLSLWFCGDPASTAGQLYVKVNGAKVTYGGDASNLTRAGWQWWNIEPASFGVNLQSVSRLAIGIDGNGASGKLYIDDIRLYPYERRFVTPTEPSAAGLAAHYKFDQNATDSSGNNNHGTLVGDPQWAAGKIGGALQFDGVDDYVDCGASPSLDITGPITIAAWVYPTGGGGGGYGRIVDKSSSTDATGPGYKIYPRAGENFVVTLSVGGGDHRSSASPALNTWNYIALVTTGTQWKFFLNGTWEEWNDTRFPSSVSNPLFIGNSSVGARHFQGMMDDVRIYNRALPSGEVAWLGGVTEPFEEPF